MPKIICLTPVKNEAWILDRFLKCASTWADHIIIADQGSDDGSPEIARRFPKVRLIENSSKTFNEPERQKMLVDAAREIEGEKLLIALDADEFLTANFRESPEWEMVLRAVPGTVIKFQWACVLPDRRSYYIFPSEFPLGFMDDGSEHQGLAIHSPRLPVPDNTARISLRGVKVLHLATIDWERFTSKIRWYQCWEFLQNRWDGRLIELYRWYHKAFHIPPEQRLQMPSEWTAGYGPEIDLLGVPTEKFYRWDKDIIRLFGEHGTKKFRRLAIWDVDWNSMCSTINNSESEGSLGDPRSKLDRWIHAWLERTQPCHSMFSPSRSFRQRLTDRLVEKLLSVAGW